MKQSKLMIMAACLVISAPAMASGSGGGGGGGGGYGGGGYSGGGFSGFESNRVDAATQTYNKGKKMFAKRVTCKACNYKTGVTDGKTAKEVASKIKAGEIKLKPDEQTAVLYYISQRYSIRT